MQKALGKRLILLNRHNLASFFILYSGCFSQDDWTGNTVVNHMATQKKTTLS